MVGTLAVSIRCSSAKALRVGPPPYAQSPTVSSTCASMTRSAWCTKSKAFSWSPALPASTSTPQISWLSISTATAVLCPLNVLLALLRPCRISGSWTLMRRLFLCLPSPDNRHRVSLPHLGGSVAPTKPRRLGSLHRVRDAPVEPARPSSAVVGHPGRSRSTTARAGLCHPSRWPLPLSGCCQNTGATLACPPNWRSPHRLPPPTGTPVFRFL